jgi:hypothetical protein
MPRHCQRRVAATSRKTKSTKNGLPVPVRALTAIATIRSTAWARTPTRGSGAARLEKTSARTTDKKT